MVGANLAAENVVLDGRHVDVGWGVKRWSCRDELGDSGRCGISSSASASASHFRLVVGVELSPEALALTPLLPVIGGRRTEVGEKVGRCTVHTPCATWITIDDLQFVPQPRPMTFVEIDILERWRTGGLEPGEWARTVMLTTPNHIRFLLCSRPLFFPFVIE